MLSPSDDSLSPSTLPSDNFSSFANSSTAPACSHDVPRPPQVAYNVHAPHVSDYVAPNFSPREFSYGASVDGEFGARFEP